MSVFHLIWSLCLVLLLSNRASFLPSCDEPQLITITRGQKISVVHWLGQNHPGDETPLDIDTTKSSDDVALLTGDGSSSLVSLDDPSSTLPSVDETTTDPTISSSFGYRGDVFDSFQDLTTADGVQSNLKEDSTYSVDDADIANNTTWSFETGKTSVAGRGERGDDVDVNSFYSTVGTEESAELSSNNTDEGFTSALADATESWAIVFINSTQDPDILVDPRDPEAEGPGTVNSSLFRDVSIPTIDTSLPPTLSTDLVSASLAVPETEVGRKVDILRSSTMTPWKKENDRWDDVGKGRLEGDSVVHGTKPFFLEKAPTLPLILSAAEATDTDDDSQTSLASSTGDVTSMNDSTLSTEVPSLNLLHESPVHYVTVLRSPDGTLPIQSLNTSQKRNKNQQLVFRNTRSINVTLCKWIFKSDPGVPLLLTFKTFSTPETPDCKDHFIAVERESNGFQSRWCGVSGDRPGHASFARSEISLYLSSNGDGSFPTGFSVEVQALDLKLLRKYAEVRRIVKSQ